MHSAKDLKESLLLPQTDFPMRANLPQKEPNILSYWDKIELYQKIRSQSKGKEKFILHDGPPYANGNIHIGTALNKILKDVINRSQQMLGKDANYIPGWDCHGLPIEWKVEENNREQGIDKKDITAIAFREQCRKFARKWLQTQRKEFLRLGILGDFQNPYMTMTREAEATIALELGKFLMNGSLYRGSKPVMWSVAEGTALAEAEIEYREHTSSTIHVAYPIKQAENKKFQDAHIVIWTTTPWTIPGSQAVAYLPDITYVGLTIKQAESESFNSMRVMVAKNLLEDFISQTKTSDHEIWGEFKGTDLANITLHHPWHDLKESNGYYDHDIPLLPADFVTDDQGTGFVHINPGAGVDDWALCKANDVPVRIVIDKDSRYLPQVALMAGARVRNEKGNEGEGNSLAIKLLQQANRLLALGELIHQYPCSWRSKKPLIFHNTPQWFIALDDENNIRDKSLSALEQVKFYPNTDRNRLSTMIANRPDWCISRQRLWGVPIPIFWKKSDDSLLQDQEVINRIVEAFKINGADAWYNTDAQEFLGSKYDAADYHQCMDVVDVWFDSGSTHAFVLEQDENLSWPADLYLEGTDQHRGWFHSSLLEACGTRGKAPYKSILTHGFVMAEDGRKMSKSLNNQVFPQDVIKEHGADILRLWVVSENYFGDMRVGPSLLKQFSDHYRRFRNTFRWLLGNLAKHPPQDVKSFANISELPLLEQWLANRLWQLQKDMKLAVNNYNFHQVFRQLHDFCASDLSAFYFDVRKDVLYCNATDNKERQAVIYLLEQTFQNLAIWLAPILCFTCEEAWHARYGNEDNQSVHLQTLADLPDAWHNEEIASEMVEINKTRDQIMQTLEVARKERSIGSSLQAKITLCANKKLIALCKKYQMDELCLVSACQYEETDAEEVTIKFELAEMEKCPRCWRYICDEADTLCQRCDSVMSS